MDAGDYDTHTVDEAREVLMGVALSEKLRSTYRHIAPGMDRSALEQLIDLAWRHQFAANRLNFKRDIRQLQEYVTKRVLADGTSL
jgi:hypothetical protein